MGLEENIRDDVNKIFNKIKEFENKWIYIKSYLDDAADDIYTYYNKFRVKSIILYKEIIEITGYEDEDKFIMNLSNLIFSKINGNTVDVRLKFSCYSIKILMNEYLPNKERQISTIFNSDKNLIITEGCTDWKHLKSALKYFNEKGEFTDLTFDFFEYENSLSDTYNLSGNTTLDKLCDYVSIFKNNKLRVFIFDSDCEEINNKHIKDCGYHFLGNNVYAVVLPIPEFRKNEPLISIENLYTDNEIKTEDNIGRRLYLSKEFCVDGFKSKDGKCSLKVDNNRPNLIIDNEVYYEDNDHSIKSKDELRNNRNKLKKVKTLSKNDFAKNILYGVEPFDKLSKENFREVFKVLEKIQHNNVEDQLGYVKEINLSPVAKMNVYDDHYELILNYLDVEGELVNSLRGGGKIISCLEKDKSNKYYIFCVSSTSIDKEYCVKLNIDENINLFIDQKILNNNKNRVYANFFDANGIYIATYEMFTENISRVIFERVRKESNSN